MRLLGKVLFVLYIGFIIYFLLFSDLYGRTGVMEEYRYNLVLLVVAVTPAICEEIAFRGALLTCFRGKRSKWTGIIIVGLFFGACHGSVWRMVPTAILGLVMGYVLFETENIFYCMLIHFTNNAFSVILTNALVWL